MEVSYTTQDLPEERQKFIRDAARLAEDISTNQTFATVKPLLNFWAAFSPSKESGIGVGGEPKDTPFGLYRDGTELRGVYYSKPEVARAACDSLKDQCDYPILLGNDPYYGGLGGDFTVITSSLANGPLVLRHELGHSIIDVGEEYDGGFAYFGVNAYHGLSKPVPWAHWLSSGQMHTPPRVERTVMPLQLYPWTLLNISTSWSTTFTSSGTYTRYLVKFSLSGLPEASDLRIELDGVDLNWVPQKDIGLDRWLYEISKDIGLDRGLHEVKFILLNQEREGVAQLCNVEVLEYGTEHEKLRSLSNVCINSHNVLKSIHDSLPSFSEDNQTTYRPTNDDCLMRSVTTPDFCKVCIEGLWLSLLRRVNLIDGIQEGCEQRALEANESFTSTWTRTLDLTLVPLAQFRERQTRAKESYIIEWRKDRKLLSVFTNQTRLVLNDLEAIGTYSINVTFATDEVRLDKDNLLTASSTYQISTTCGSALT
ncbi:hypothetical protein C0992_003467 [Termitomyces sp. T32_za158]|nr:hypothetical protein C0992_003467 [Termitomyces sp. T32_za158]